MARIEIPAQLLSAIGPEMKMDVHWVDVRLANGRKIHNLVVRGGRYITGRETDINGEGIYHLAPMRFEPSVGINHHGGRFGKFNWNP
jgi:hypothetical protein